SHTGNWSADFTAQPPEYHGSGALEHASMEQLAQAMHDGWITGTANAIYEVTSAGLNTSKLLSSAVGKLRVEVNDGVLPHIELANSNGPLRIHRLAASFTLHDGA